MLDIKFIRENIEKVKESCRNRGVACEIDRLLDLDQKRRELIQQTEEAKAEQNLLSKSVASSPQGAGLDKAKVLKSEIKSLKTELQAIESDFSRMMRQVPNIVFDDAPVGQDEENNEVVKTYGKQTKFDFTPTDHLELGQKLGIIDVERAGKISGSRFSFLKKELVFLEFALVRFALDLLVKKGFIPVIPPVLIKPEMMEKMGYIDTPADKEERYFLEKDKLMLVGTAEQAIGPMHAGEIFELKDLPKRYAGFSTCFREEAGSYGKDTRGILRQHQFDKIEMFSFSSPEKSPEEHQFLIGLEEKLMQELGLPYQLVHLCTGDMARVSASTFDIETWMPGEQRYRETHSCSNCADFQARRLNIRYRNEDNKLEFVHMLNGTAFAIGRTLIAILENNQKKDGSIEIPKVLHKYLNFKKIESK